LRRKKVPQTRLYEKIRAEADREIGRKVEANLPESRLAEIERYERAACGYSLQLLREAGVRDLDQ
jgi:hypothetical protein